MNDADRALCAVTARWLAACARTASALGLGAAGLLALWALLRPAPPSWAWLAGAFMPFERLLALRLHFDAGLFADLGAGRTTLLTLDAALDALQLRRAAAQTRPLAERVAAARRLAWQHLAVACAQLSILVLSWGLAVA